MKDLVLANRVTDWHELKALILDRMLTKFLPPQIRLRRTGGVPFTDPASGGERSSMPVRKSRQ